MQYKIVITTSGIGNRLGDITKYTNKSLVRVGRKPAISYIIEAYPEEVEVVVTLGYYGQQVKEFLTIAYPNRKFSFVEVDKFEGEGSSLLYSLLQAKDQLNCPFIFHACDTIIENQKIPSPNVNYLMGFVKTHNTSHYRTFNLENGYVKKVNNKGELNYDYEYMGVCGIKDHDLFWKLAEKIYKIDDMTLSDCDVIREMINEVSFTYVKASSWLDIGNVSSLNHARENISDKFELLDKLDESTFFINDSVIKFFNNEKTVKSRVERASYLKGLTPNLINSSNNFYQYEYVQGELLAESTEISLFNDFLKWCKHNLWKKVNVNEDFGKICHKFYYEKTIERINKFQLENNITDKENIINGVVVPKISTLLSKIDFDSFCSGEFYNFHGDLILDNVIYDDDRYYLLDWRQDFGGITEGGDIYYDFAKLNHNLILNHKIINDNLFTINTSGNKITCDIMRKDSLVRCEKVLHDFIKNSGFNINKVNILTPLIWLNMSPLHHYPFNLFLYYFGKYILHLRTQ